MQIVEQAGLLVAPGSRTVEFQGRAHGSGVSFIMVSTDVEGAGPRLHRHPYDETFVIRSGSAQFTISGQKVAGRAGQIIVVPAMTPHRFARTGDGTLELIDIHASDHFSTEWLDDQAP